MVVKNGKIKSAEIVASINDSGSTVKIAANHIILDGQAVADSLNSTGAFVGHLNTNSTYCSESLQCDGWVKGLSCDFVSGTIDTLTASDSITGGSITGSTISGSTVSSSGLVTASSGFKTGGYTATWQSFTYRHCTVSSSYTFKDTSGTNRTGKFVTATTDTTIYYLGR